ncbi:MAG: DUF4340 domain-containing protein, partial [Thermoanaerobaculia bacterium]
MSPRKLLFLTVSVLLLFGFILLFERKMPTTEEREQKGNLIWELPQDSIESLELSHSGSVVELTKGEKNAWRLTKPEAYPADTIAVSDLVSQLASLKRSGGDSGDARPEDYGFQTPSAKATIVWKEQSKAGKKLSRTLELGVEIPGTDATAARVAGKNAVVFVSTSLANAVKKSANDFKSKDVFGGSALDVERLEVERGRGRLSLVKKNSVWWLQQPFSDLADGDFVGRLIGELTGLRVLEFLGPADQENLAGLGLAPPLYRVALSDAKGPGTTVDFGSTRSDGNSLDARRETQVFAVSNTALEDLSKEAVAFREPRLVRFERLSVAELEGTFPRNLFALTRQEGGWNLRGGGPLLASTADDLVTTLLDLKSRSFQEESEARALAAREPAATVTAKLSEGEPWTLRFYPRRGETQATVSGRPGAFLLSGDAVSNLEAAFRKAASAAVPTP